MSTSKTLTKPALDLIDHYQHLKLGNHEVVCPYFNNRRSQVRAGLRVLVGKGSPSDIEEEAALIAFREKIELTSLNSYQIKKFLIDNSLGIECSGFVYHILEQELWEKKKKHLRSVLSFPYAKNPLRKLLVKLRPIENTGVKSLAHEKNSTEIALKDIRPGDIITMLEGDTVGNPDHVLLVHFVQYDGDTPELFHYTHAIQWKSDGVIDHGIAEGRILINEIDKPLLEQEWTEIHESSTQNETFERAKRSKLLSLRRLKALA